MEAFNALKQADEVKTFPSINMPAPLLKPTGRATGRGRFTEKHKNLFYNNSTGPRHATVTLPGLLKTRKTKLIESGARTNEGSTFTGFNATTFKLDLGESKTSAYDSIASYKPDPVSKASESFAESTTVDNVLVHSDVLSTGVSNFRSKPKKEATATENTLDELRSYITLMDKYSLHNFMIYEGRALTETPEFQSFKRTYQYKWGAINHIILQLEEFFQKHEVKLAIINGPRLFDLSKLNLPALNQRDLYSMITNIDQIEVLIDAAALSNNTEGQVQRTILRVQTLMRGWIARVRFRKLQKSIAASILLQSVIRKFLYRRYALQLLRAEEVAGNAKFLTNRSRIGQWWKSRTLDPGEDRTRLVVYIPSINITEYLRMDCENFRAVQNAHISNIFQLADPDLHLVYITPFLMTNSDKAYHEKFLSVLGVSILPKRLHFITPERINYLPQHLSLSSALWYSPNALNKLRTFTRRFRSTVMVPTTVTWVEKRIATYLDISLLAPDSSIAETISSRSYMKSIFMASSVNIPLGSHDIYSLDDLYVALSRLISSNVGVGRWLIRLNTDWNNESTATFDVGRLPLIVNLRLEQHNLATQHDNVAAWFSREIQLAVRKRVLQMLKKELPSKLHLCRKDIYPDFDYYIRLLKQYGAVVEAEPLEKLGYVDGICFVDPTGEVHGCKGVEVHTNEQYQAENYVYPQTITPRSALEGATEAIARNLFTKYHVVGYVTVQYLSFWDAHDKIPRLWAVGLQLGLRSTHGAMGTLAVATQPAGVPTQMPLSLLPDIPEGKFAVYIPIVAHDPLKHTHDDAFFKVCRMRGIAFDAKNRVGSLFFMVDSVVGGAISLLCIGSTRRKSLEIVVHTLSFIAREFGMDTVTSPIRYENLTSMLINLKKLLRNAEKLEA